MREANKSKRMYIIINESEGVKWFKSLIICKINESKLKQTNLKYIGTLSASH